MDLAKLKSTATKIIDPGKGILAADEGGDGIKKRFDPISVEITDENRRWYREMLFTTPGIEQFISGVILSDDIFRSSTLDGVSFPSLLIQKGIIPGIKVDKGPQQLAGLPGEKVTDGLDGLHARLEQYYNQGAQFAKWRAVINIGDTIPSRACLESNAEMLACYAALCQDVGLVPIVEPEVMMEGSHSLDRCATVTLETLQCVFSRLISHRVCLQGILLKPNMILPGNKSNQKVNPHEIAEVTLRVLLQVVPAAVPGITFLSGGQKPLEATVNLNTINTMGTQPWRLTFSYARALQEPFLEVWAGNPNNTRLGQQSLYHRAKCNGAASCGKYSQSMELVS
jgi:fructose-bisphosphate aldolase class I